MNLPVNLLEDAEVRNTSRVSRKFLIQLAVGMVVVVAVGWVGLLLWKQSSLGRQVRHLQAEYDEMKPRQERVNELLDNLRWHEDVMDELTGWQAATVAWHEELDALAQVVPTNMQFVSMEVTGSLQLRPSEQDQPTKFWRQYKIDLIGIAQGEDPDNTVLSFIKALPETENLQEHWESGKLHRIQNEVAGPNRDEVVGRRFELAVSFKEREW